MCDPTLMMAVNVASKVVSYQEEKRAARAQERANAITRTNLRKGLADDTARIKELASEKAKEKARAKIKLERNIRKNYAEFYNLGAGNAIAGIKDIASDGNIAYNENTSAFKADMSTLHRKQLESYGAFKNNWNSIPQVKQPSLLGTMLGIGMDYGNYRMDKAKLTNNKKTTSMTTNMSTYQSDALG